MSQTSTNLKRRRLCAVGVTGFVLVLCGIAGASAVHHLKSTPGSAAPTSASAAARSGPSRVHALGRLEPAGTVRQISPRSGNEGTRVEKLLVREGEDVAAGAILAVLDNESPRQAALAEADARLELAKSKLEQVRAGAKAGDIAAQEFAVEVQSEQKKVAEREWKRAKDLHAKNVVTREDLDNKQWLLDRVTLEHRRAQEQLKSVREVRDIDLRVAERDVAAAQASVRRAQVDLEAAQVHSPAAGRILKIHTREGERIGEAGLLELGDVLHMEAVAEVFEADVVHLRLGQSASVKVDCLEEPLTGEVAEIGHRVARKVVLTNDPVSDTDARVVEARIRLAPDAIPRVVRLSNARVEVTIDVQSE